MLTQSQFRYWAFISYSHHDARAANALLKRLGRANVPSSQRSRVEGASKYFHPNFLDEREAAAASDLNDALRAAMRASAKLIVLCSPFSARSAYVRQEVQFFLDEGRGSDILCLVVSGIAGATGADSVLDPFPEPLRLQPTLPLAARVGSETEAEWGHAVDQLTAGMLGEPLAHRRDWLRKRQQRRLAVGGATVLLSLTGVFLLCWLFWIPQHQFAMDGMRRWGEWVPVDPISNKLARRRPFSLLFTRQGAFGPWNSVRWVNGEGQCASTSLVRVPGDAPQSIVGDPFRFSCTRSEACEIRLIPSAAGVIREEVLDQYGQTLETLTYARPGLAIIDDAVIGCSRREGSIKVVRLERVPDGPLVGTDARLRFENGPEMAARPNAQYAFGLLDERTAQGRLMRRTFLDEGGNPRGGAEGYAMVRYDYDAAGNRIAETLLGLDAKPVMGKQGFATKRRSFDDSGRVIMEWYLDTKDRPVPDASGVYGQQVRWGENGRFTAVTNLGWDRKPVADRTGVATYKYSYPKKFGVLRTDYLDADGKSTLDAEDRCAATEEHKPFENRLAEKKCFGVDGAAAYSINGWHTKRTEFTDRWQVASNAFFGIVGEPVLCQSHGGSEYACPVHRVVNTFDADNRHVQRRYVGLRGDPELSDDGIAGADLLYDADSRLKREINVGLDGHPTRDRESGTVALEYVYDAYGRNVEVRTVDSAGQPASGIHPVTSKRTTYDGLGNPTSTEFLDAKGQRVLNPKGVAIYRNRFDHMGRTLETLQFDAMEEPAADSEGWYGTRFSYDQWGRPVAYERLGKSGAPEPGVDGILSRRLTYDSRGFKTRMELRDANDRLAANADGVAVWTWVVNDHGRVLSRPCEISAARMNVGFAA